MESKESQKAAASLDEAITRLKDDESPMWENLPGYEEAFRRGCAACDRVEPVRQDEFTF